MKFAAERRLQRDCPAARYKGTKKKTSKRLCLGDIPGRDFFGKKYFETH